MKTVLRTVRLLLGLAGIALIWTPGSGAAQSAGALSGPGRFDHLQLGTSFDCSRTGQDIPTLVCSDPDLRLADLRQMQVYYALRHAAPGRVQEFRNQFLSRVQALVRECSVETARGWGAQKACAMRGLNDMRSHWLAQLQPLNNPAAVEESGLGVEQLLGIQEALQTLGFISNTAVADGVYGNATREAITRFQSDRNIPPSGFASTVTVRQLLGTVQFQLARVLEQRSDRDSLREAERLYAAAAESGVAEARDAGERVRAALRREEAEAARRQYVQRQKTILEEILNYTTSGADGGITNNNFDMWIGENLTGHRCVLQRFVHEDILNRFPEEVRRALRAHPAVLSAMSSDRIDLRRLNPTEFAVQVERIGGVNFMVVRARTYQIINLSPDVPSAHGQTIPNRDRLQRAWQVAFRACQ